MPANCEIICGYHKFAIMHFSYEYYGWWVFYPFVAEFQFRTPRVLIKNSDLAFFEGIKLKIYVEKNF
jgi:hypothetical protein